jgi:hypothetical protein
MLIDCVREFVNIAYRAFLEEFIQPFLPETQLAPFSMLSTVLSEESCSAFLSLAAL